MLQPGATIGVAIGVAICVAAGYSASLRCSQVFLTACLGLRVQGLARASGLGSRV